MRRVVPFVLAAVVALSVQPALAQTASSTTMPAGTQNPAVVQPHLVAPPELVPPPAPQPAPAAPPSDAPPSPSSLIIPGGAGGLCECLINHDPSLTVFDKTKMHQTCLASAEACQALCNTPRFFSFVPHAVFTCPGRPGEEVRPVAARPHSPMRVAAAR
ncbi:MAG TPA: hypothetical protein VG651_17920 [Stellaceae bacterium]|nr:hypothetical protein [Stellaceae bacterium]